MVYNVKLVTFNLKDFWSHSTELYLWLGLIGKNVLWYRFVQKFAIYLYCKSKHGVLLKSESFFNLCEVKIIE